MPGASQEPRLRTAAVVAGHGRREDDPQPLCLPQGLPAEEGICQVIGRLEKNRSKNRTSIFHTPILFNTL